MSARRNPLPSCSPAPFANPDDPDDFVIIRKWNVTRTTFWHEPYSSGDFPPVFHVLVTVDSRIVIQDVQIRVRGPEGVVIDWPWPWAVSIDGIICTAFLSSRARDRVGKQLVNRLVESDSRRRR